MKKKQIYKSWAKQTHSQKKYVNTISYNRDGWRKEKEGGKK